MYTSIIPTFLEVLTFSFVDCLTEVLLILEAVVCGAVKLLCYTERWFI